jgi:hypothetical protein
MIVNASSKRSMRWSYGKPNAPNSVSVPAGAETEDEPAAADLVERGGLLGEQRGIVEVRAGDERPELDPARDGRDRGERRPGLPTGRGRAGRASG